MTWFARYAKPEEIPVGYFNAGKELRGIVTHVPDGDGFKFYHQPTLSCSPPNIPRHPRDAAEVCLTIRLAGIDAPEMGHQSSSSRSTAQPYADEARNYLRSLVEGKTVLLKVHGIDQYGRVIASAYTRRYLFFWQNLSLAMVVAGLAVVYEGQGAHYGGIRTEVFAAQQCAKSKHRGIWSQKKSQMVTPAEYKRNHKK